ncbi:BatA domain-containing protein [Urechidicola croceus]|uniref:Aerotolerance regulator N-terminal domain-containing protein n=1 Tax=Urechidicola croceus TaxID=1850246 RepID=A0A1D8P498_9FLAO|nr:BatA domain-containing protein [Urechidicola croceus]AOW19399.1 hypothetical protein LPB138_01290 [Urechidicola croceus]
MHYKHPEILYALLLLIIPIIIHLFQLQRFKKTPFTNVKFLKRIELKSRKSSQLKKWLILLTRLLVFTSIIIAFSQPYFSNFDEHQEYNTILYLDNSLSMQAKGERGEILKKVTQDIIENFNSTKNISLITNDKIFRNLNNKSLKNELLRLTHSANQLDFKSILLKANQLKSTESNTLNKIILISDYQSNIDVKKYDVTNVNSPISLINVTPKKIQNISIDTLFISNQNNQNITLKVVINNTNINQENVAISLFNNTILTGKTTSSLSENTPSEVEFKISSEENFNGKIVIEDENLQFDNTLFFCISKPEKINVISIGKNANYLSKIYTKSEFNFSQKNLNSLDYNSIQNQNLVILNELDNIPNSLTNTLKSFLENGGNICVIPSQNISIESYNVFLNKLNLGSISSQVKNDLKVTTINYDHPILKDVFEKKVQNFQYPSINQYYKTLLSNSSKIISLENHETFISEIKKQKGSVYWFASSLENSVSNFKNSPLIVPILYNFGKFSFKIPQLYYTNGLENTIEIKTQIQKDEVLKLKNDSEEFIPIQQVFYNKVKITTTEQPHQNGFYNILRNNKSLRNVAYNYNRSESELKYSNITELFKESENISISNSVKETFINLNKQQEIKSLFKWFLALAVLFLLLEILILKFFKV